MVSHTEGAQDQRMDETGSPTATAPPPPPPPTGDRKCLTRSTRDKVLCGVAGGLGNYFSIDPVIFRIGFVALTFAGGSGIALYFLAWLVLPDDAGGAAPVQGLSKGATHPAQVPAILIIGGIVVLVLLNDDGHDHALFDGAFWPLVLVGIGLYLWVRKPTLSSADRPVGASSEDAEPAATESTPATSEPTDATGTTTTASTSPPTAEQAYTPPWRTDDDPAPPVPSGPRVHSVTGSVLSLLLIVAGGATLLHTTDVLDVSVEGVLALLLTITGVALLASAWIGRGRGLLLVAALLTAALGTASAIDVPLTGGVGERVWRPTTSDELARPYRLGIGEAILDLRSLQLEPGEEFDVEASVAIGHLVILVPPTIATTIDTQAGVGETVVFGLRDDGRRARARLGDVEVLAPEAEPDRPAGDAVRVARPRVNIDARVGLGQVEVRRVAA